MQHITISGRSVGAGDPVFIVAELSANHRQDLDIALKTIEAVKDVGADAVKFQTYKSDTITLDCCNDYFKIKQGTIWDGKTLHELYSEAFTPWEWFPQLVKKALDVGLIWFSSPFDKTSVDFLENLNVPAYKIASFEITDLPLIEYVASKGKPVIISTGVATFDEIVEAHQSCKKAGNDKIAFLKCSSVYPTPYSEINLKTIQHLRETLNTVTGLSDHTPGISAPIAATALGAHIIEKHFILDKALGGPDSAFSLDPEAFRRMVNGIRETEAALGNVTYDISSAVKKSREHARSLFVVKDMRAHEAFTTENVQSIRPAYGLPPKYLTEILTKRAKVDIKRGTPLSWDIVED
ncbi:pseudaminic acid synthase [Candidatus Magnetomonas plexicatena]|uniref:pseudaminic acid synthase n=1 Tax=Candidatus Magnetomonas plexicatena TaxID=2552947 RepID=UPI001102763D|nr:pseudaminic acid synthase [Nitrospirales bacterium LBB_01]